MEDGLVPFGQMAYNGIAYVLILVVMEDGLVLYNIYQREVRAKGLNPCCNGRWSRTRLYKTILIINKLQNFTK